MLVLVLVLLFVLQKSNGKLWMFAVMDSFLTFCLLEAKKNVQKCQMNLERQEELFSSFSWCLWRSKKAKTEKKRSNDRDDEKVLEQRERENAR